MNIKGMATVFDCKKSIELLVDYVDGAMAPEEAKRLQAHLSGCAPCEEFVHGYRATPKLCKEALAQSMPPELADKLTRRPCRVPGMRVGMQADLAEVVPKPVL